MKVKGDAFACSLTDLGLGFTMEILHGKIKKLIDFLTCSIVKVGENYVESAGF